jgi:hypothetical protein
LASVFMLLLLLLGYLAVIDLVATSCSGSKKLQGANLVKITKGRKITLLKTSPKVEKITFLIQVPRKQTSLKNTARLGKRTVMEKTSAKETNLVKNLECLAS